MEGLRTFFAHAVVRRILFLLLVVLLLYSLRDMLNLLLLLFLVTFVMGRLQGFVVKKINRFFPISPVLVTVCLYVLLVSTLVFGMANYLPKIVSQIVDMINNINRFLTSSQNDEVVGKLVDALEKVDYQKYLGNAVEYIMKLGKWLEIILFVILLSFFYLLQRTKIVKFTEQFRESKIGWAYKEFHYFGGKFASSFGKVVEVQLLIAVFNTVLTMIGLWIMGFPYLVAITTMVFLLSLIPVAGVIISFIPIGIIGYQVGGFSLVLWAIVMILVIHSLETYFLNPRLYAHKTKLPMFYTFFILIFSQHFMGIWGLIIGIPIFMFLLDVLEVRESD
ncbi:putative PurR-regulated permease PerM [Paenibacillus castaneae]|uniref:AI-2E family transporter n=1 Tax=Paenibacillus castaneae TaxID=474957 RepID=UPI000C9A67C6|nr:AI-2E family transporter [Paenibacillus castaneae]NIK77832.1 putative PurR-regulated permease PerM [Paenibacillus castaneae]